MKRLILPLLLLAASCAQQNNVVSVDGGQLQGVPGEASGVVVFKGIPYAAPPVGEFR